MNYDLEMTVSPSEFERELCALINHHSRENESDTPDFILADYMMNCLKAFERATIMRSLWYEDSGHAVLKRDMEAIVAIEGDSPAAFRAAKLIAQKALGAN